MIAERGLDVVGTALAVVVGAVVGIATDELDDDVGAAGRRSLVQLSNATAPRSTALRRMT